MITQSSRGAHNERALDPMTCGMASAQYGGFGVTAGKRRRPVPREASPTRRTFPSGRRALSAGTKQLRGACRLLHSHGDIASEPKRGFGNA
jgi:hypothetical protein